MTWRPGPVARRIPMPRTMGGHRVRSASPGLRMLPLNASAAGE
ncbi:hypothetical protein SLEP1_g30533 [Rubroshorea leprosula]|uniref:Uncharacterized protein n=1 Tax=Rubroshorea leprosula TaxID=152421 RepID=A0AAV5KA02_9ROSI|nr:hypothetical protein SLEP1_g30533 [Rubroshorea leprosula]